MAQDAVGALYFDLGVDDKAVSTLLKQIEGVRKTAQAALDTKLTDGLDKGFTKTADGVKLLIASYKELSKDATALAKALDAVGKGAGNGTKPLTEGQKAARGYAAEIKALNAERKAGTKSEADTVTRLKAITGELSKGLGALDKTSKEYGEYRSALDAAGTSLKKIETAQRQVQKALADTRVREVASGLSDLKVRYEALEVSQDDFVLGARQAYDAAADLRKEFELGTPAYKRLTDQMGIATRSITTAEGRVSKLGLSQQVLLGQTNLTRGALSTFGGVLGGISFAGAIKGSFDYASNLEQLGVSFETILGSGEDAKNLLADLESFSASTPFQFPELAEAAKSLAAFGVAGDDIVPTLQRVGDVAAGVGAPIGEIAEIYGKARVQGRLFAEDINQLTGRGIPIIQELAKQFGITEGEVKAMVESGEVGFENLEQAFVSLTSEGGKFFGLTQAQSETTAGKLSTLADNATAAGGQFIEVLLPSLEGVVDGASAVASGLGDMDPALAGMVVQGGLAAGALIPLSAGLGAVVSVAPKVAAGLNLIRTASLGLFLPPTGLFIAGAAAVVGLGTVLYRLSQDTEPLADTLARLDQESADLKTGMETAAQGVDTLLAATDQQGLKGAVENLSGLLTGEAKQAFVTLAEQAIASGADIDTVTQQILEGFLEAQIKLIEFNRNATQARLADAQRDLLGLERAAGDPQLESIRTQIAAQEQLIGKLRERQQTVGDVSDAEILTIQANLTANRELEASYVQAGQGHTQALAEQQAEVGALTNVLDEQNKAIEQLEAAASNPSSLAESQTGTATVVDETTTAIDGQSTALETQTEIVNRATTANRTLGEVSLEVLAAQKQYQDSLLAAGGRDIITPQVTATLDLFSRLRQEILLNQQALAQDQDAATEWGKVYERVYGESGRAATEAAELEGRAFRDRAANQRQSIVDTETLAATLAYYSREAETSYDQTEANGEAIEATGQIIRDRIKAEDEWSERMAISSGWTTTQTEAQETLLKTLKGDFAKGYDNAIERAELFGEAQTGTAAEMERLRAEIEFLLDKGLEPSDKAVQELSEQYKTLQGELDAATEATEANEKIAEANAEATENLADAQGQMADAASLSKDDITNLELTLKELATSETDAADGAKLLLSDLRALEVSRGLADVFAVIGEAANFALENIPGLSVEAEASLSALGSAAEAAGEALQDGMVSPQEAIGVLGAGLDSLAEGLIDEVSPAAYAGIKAVDGLAQSALSFATGDIIGGITSLIGTAIGGITDYFFAAQREAERVLETTKEIAEVSKEIRDIQQDNKDSLAESEDAVLEARLDFVVNSDSFSDAEKEFAQLKTDLVDRYREYQDDIQPLIDRGNEINTELQGINNMLATGVGENGERLTAGQIADLKGLKAQLEAEQASLDEQFANYQEAYGIDIAAMLEDTSQLAKDLGISQEDLYTALFTGNEEILGQLTGEQQQALKQGLVAYFSVFGEFPPGAEEAAASLGLSNEQLVTEMNTGTTNISTAATTGAGVTRQAVADLNQQLVDMFGPEAAGPIKALILQTFNDQAGAVTDGTTTLSTAATDSAGASRTAVDGLINQLLAMFGPEVSGPIIDLINQAFGDQAGALGTGTTTLSTKANTSGTTLSGSYGDMFEAAKDSITAVAPSALVTLGDAFKLQRDGLLTGSGLVTTQAGTSGATLGSSFQGIFQTSKDAIAAYAPGANTALTDALGNIRTGLVGDGTLLSDELLARERDLAERQKDLFYEQQIMAGKYGPLAKAELEKQIAAEKQALINSVNGSGGLVGNITGRTRDVTLSLGTFFSDQRGVVTREAGSTVRTIGDATTAIRNAMNSLAGAASAGRSAAAGASGRGGGGGGRGVANLFTPLNQMFDSRLLGGFGDDFHVSSLLYGNPEDDLGGGFERDVFGYGTALPVRPVGELGAAPSTSAAGSLSPLLGQVRGNVTAYKTGVLSAVEAARQTQARAFGALGYDFRKGIQEEAKKNAATVKKTAEDYKNMEQEFLSSLTLLDASGILKRAGGVRSGLFDFTKQIATAIESGFKQGIQGGSQAFLEGTGTMLETLQRDAFDQLASGTIAKLLNSGLLEKLLGGVYSEFTTALAGGNTQQAIAAFQKVMAKLPSVAGQLEGILAPIRDLGKGLGFYGEQASASTTGAAGITLQERSIGSASPAWMGDFGALMTKAADTMARAGDRQFEAAVRLERAAAKAESNASAERARKGSSSKF